MRVLYILPTSSIYAGDSLSILNLITGLSKYKVDHLIVLTEKGSLSDKLDELGFPYRVITYPPTAYVSSHYRLRDSIFFLWRLTKFYFSERQIAAIVKEFKPDIIHSNTGPTMAGNKVAKDFGIPHVWHIREYLDLDFNAKLFISPKEHRRRLAHKNNHVIAITKDIFRYYNLSKKDRVIYNGILKADEARFSVDKEKYFLFVGRLTETKGTGQLIKAFIKFAKNNADYQLLLAGLAIDESYREALANEVNLNKLEHRVQFLGARNDVANLMASATALIVPSVSEGFGRITAEAMFNGCLVIGNNSAGTKEILEENALGILYAGEAELVAAMQEVVSRGIESYYPVIKKAQDHAVSLYSQERNSSDTYKYYKEILQN